MKDAKAIQIYGQDSQGLCDKFMKFYLKFGGKY